MSRLVFAFMWLVHFLPVPVIAAVGSLTGAILFWLIPERRKVTRINLEKCFPRMPAAQRDRLARAHFRAFTRAFIEQGILWWSSRERIEKLVTVEGLETLSALAGSKIILFAPHFVGFEATLARLALEFPVAMMYSRQKDPLFEARLLRGRTRFGGVMFPRQAGIKTGIRIIESGTLYYYLPDL